ncbi:hypothetical protein KIH77_07225 [Bifidobacterium sp. 82T24]|uniref:hypothetical protein n=1 Tax=Bifidobacterium pluvialisilvae TaxID=2834436 RepID=UPI001C58D548|nr:hypothetical protein [Bifidobacterium pluvialisilvae]MBW3088521.1 hypothetical protein [Bifidobacterium pluvialisilvae]
MTMPQNPQQHPHNTQPRQPQPGWDPQTPPQGQSYRMPTMPQNPGNPNAGAAMPPQYQPPMTNHPNPAPTQQTMWQAQPPAGYGEQRRTSAGDSPVNGADVDEAGTTKMSVILMVVFLGIDMLETLIGMVPGVSASYGSIVYKIFIGFSPWVYFTVLLALYLLGVYLAKSLPWYGTVGPVLVAVGAVAKLINEILWIFEIYGIIGSLLNLIAYGILLALAVVILLAILGTNRGAGPNGEPGAKAA